MPQAPRKNPAPYAAISGAPLGPNFAGFEALPTRDGAEAIEIFKRRGREAAAVLLDLTMPGMDGWDVAVRLREINPAVPILMMSGYNPSAPPEGCALEKPPEFLTKPFQAHDLIARISRMAMNVGRP